MLLKNRQKIKIIMLKDVNFLYVQEKLFNLYFIKSVIITCMITISILAIILTVCIISANLSPVSVSSSLTFQNITGAGTTKEMLDSFIAFANFASITYQDDIAKNVKFIKFRMDELYGKANSAFYIIIQTDEAISNAQYWVSMDYVYATLSGINKQYPKWSYLFARHYGSKHIPDYTFFGKDQIGKQVTSDFLKQVKSLIDAAELTDTCLCPKQSLKDMSNQLQFLTGSAWSVVCDSKGITSALVRTLQVYLSIRQKKCYYTIYPGF